jgi:hypothetical protein
MTIFASILGSFGVFMSWFGWMLDRAFNSKEKRQPFWVYPLFGLQSIALIILPNFIYKKIYGKSKY